MKDDLKVEVEQTAEEAWNNIVSGFNSPEELAKAYNEAKKPLSDDEGEFLKQVKSMFGETLKESSKLENAELKSLSHELRDSVNVPTRVMDAAVAKTARYIKETEKNNNIAAARSVLNDGLKKQAIEKALGDIGGKVASTFQERLQSGQVSKYELEILISQGKDAEESSTSFDFGSETQKKSTQEELWAELQDINRNKAAIWTNLAHPLYKQTVNRKEELKKKLKIA